MAEYAIESHRRRRFRVPALFLAGSAAVHAAVLVALPETGHERVLSEAPALEVVIVRGEAPVTALAPHHPLSSPPRRPATIRASPEPRADRQVLPAMQPKRWMAEGVSFAVESASVPEPALPTLEQRPTGSVAAVAPAGITAASAYLRNPAPSYPLASRRAGEQGTVTLRVLVSADGLASRVTVENSSGSPHLDAAALEAVKAWRFTPARQGGEPVDSWMLVPVVFRLEGTS